MATPRFYIEKQKSTCSIRINNSTLILDERDSRLLVQNDNGREFDISLSEENHDKLAELFGQFNTKYRDANKRIEILNKIIQQIKAIDYSNRTIATIEDITHTGCTIL